MCMLGNERVLRSIKQDSSIKGLRNVLLYINIQMLSPGHIYNVLRQNVYHWTERRTSTLCVPFLRRASYQVHLQVLLYRLFQILHGLWFFVCTFHGCSAKITRYKYSNMEVKTCSTKRETDFYFHTYLATNKYKPTELETIKDQFFLLRHNL